MNLISPPGKNKKYLYNYAENIIYNNSNNCLILPSVDYGFIFFSGKNDFFPVAEHGRNAV